MTDEQIARIAADDICPACGGRGCFEDQIAICCGNATRNGECCGMPVGEHVIWPCEPCNETGLRVRAHIMGEG